MLERVMKDFDTRAFGAYIRKADAPANVKPVIVLEGAEKRLTVGSSLVKDGNFEMIYAPWYLFVPGALSKDNTTRNFDRPALGAEGKRLLTHLLGLLK